MKGAAALLLLGLLTVNAGYKAEKSVTIGIDLGTTNS